MTASDVARRGRRVAARGAHAAAGFTVRKRALLVSLAVAVSVAGAVLISVHLGGEEYESRAGLLAVASENSAGQYGEVVALSLPALVEVSRSPSVLRAPAEQLGATTDELARRVSVELVPASGMARLSVRAPTAEQAARAASLIAQAVVDANLLAPAARLRLLDRPETTRVAPDWPLAVGLALVASVLAGLAAYAVGYLRRTRAADRVRAALIAGGVRHPVVVLPDDDPALTGRLTVLCEASARPARVVAVVPELTGRAEALAATLPDKTGEPAEGDAVIAIVPAGGRRHDELAAVVGALPISTTVVAVVVS